MTDMTGPAQADVDERIQAYYGGEFAEALRLTTRSAQGRLEFERTQELVRARIPAAARVLDVGGATGVHAAPLADAGHDVVLIDPVPEQVAAAATHGTFVAQVGDARRLPFVDGSFDAVLLLGPLYHLAGRDDRLLALREAVRVVRPGGYVFAAGIPRLLAHTALSILTGASPASLVEMLERGVPSTNVGFPAGHFHTAKELAAELTEAGLANVTVVGVEGPAGFALELMPAASEELHRAAMTVARAADSDPRTADTSNHLLGFGTV